MNEVGNCIKYDSLTEIFRGLEVDKTRQRSFPQEGFVLSGVQTLGSPNRVRYLSQKIFLDLAFKCCILSQNYVGRRDGFFELSYTDGSILFTTGTQFCGEFQVLINSYFTLIEFRSFSV
jgi:hypothetical protein